MKIAFSIICLFTNEENFRDTPCRFDALGNHIFIIVSDNGKGISQDNIDRIFQPFYTLNQQDWKPHWV
jgi:signal transduction histidine kinase